MNCIICGRKIDSSRKGKDTCSPDCGLKKSIAWAKYIKLHKEEIMNKAIEEYLEEVRVE